MIKVYMHSNDQMKPLQAWNGAGFAFIYDCIQMDKRNFKPSAYIYGKSMIACWRACSISVKAIKSEYIITMVTVW